MEGYTSPVVADMLETYKRIVELEARLRSLRRRLGEAGEYLRRPGSNQALGRSQYDRLKEQWSDTVAALGELGRRSEGLLQVA